MFGIDLPQKPQQPKKKADIAAMNSRATGVEASKRQKGMSVISD